MASARQLSHELERKMASLSDRHRRELKQMLGNPPDPSNVPESFWQEVEREQRQQMMEVLALLFLLFAMKPMKRGGGGIAESTASTLAQQFAQARAAFVAQKYADNARNRLAVWVRRVDPGQPLPPDKIDSGIDVIIGRKRIGGIVTTEMTKAQAEALQKSKDVQEVDQKKKLKLMWVLGPCRHCTFCPLVAGTSDKFWSQFIATGPPAHVNCCCRLDLRDDDAREMPWPNPATVIAAAKDSGIFGY